MMFSSSRNDSEAMNTWNKLVTEDKTNLSSISWGSVLFFVIDGYRYTTILDLT